MNLYLVRHGIAAGAGDDPPLSDEGVVGIQRLASFLARSGMKPERVIHSPLLRARQTAQLLSAVVSPGLVTEAVESGLYPEDSTDAVTAAVEDWQEDVMLVGHMFNISRLAARFITGSDEGAVVVFERGTVVCLERQQAGYGWGLSWSISPRLLGK